MMIGAAAGVAGCSSATGPDIPTYFGPDVTRIQVFKEQRKMQLLHHNSLLRQYDVALGFNPREHKQQEGDGRTPEGQFFINRRNPNSSFHLSLGINYPRPEDIAAARELGKSPGGDIFIHGNSERSGPRARNRDWTWGCIAVTDREMERIYAMVQNGTVVDIYP